MYRPFPASTMASQGVIFGYGEAHLEPKKNGIRLGLSFSERQERNWAMLGVCWLKLGFQSLLEANLIYDLAAWRAAAKG